MLVISAREFRQNQKSYLDKVQDGLELLITRGKKQSFKVVKVEEDDTLMSKEEFYKKIEEARAEYRKGETMPQKEGESISDFIDRLLCTK